MTYTLGKVEGLGLLFEDGYELLDSLCEDLVVAFECGNAESPVPRLSASRVLYGISYRDDGSGS
jgi:hypothetical protein